MSKYIDEKTKRLLIGLGAVVGLIVLIIVIIAIINSFKVASLSYTEIEDKMVEAAQKYYAKESNLLPLNDNTPYFPNVPSICPLYLEPNPSAASSITGISYLLAISMIRSIL